MLSGIKFVPRDQLLQHDSDPEISGEAKGNSRSRKQRQERKKSRHRRDSSDDGEGAEGAKRQSERRTKKSKKRYSSDDSSSSSLEPGSENESESLSNDDKKRRSKRRRRRRRWEGSSDSSDKDETNDRRTKRGKESRERDKVKGINREFLSDDDGELITKNENLLLRKKMGLEWMLSSGSKDRNREQTEDELKPQVEVEKTVEEINRTNTNELNPYLKDNGSGYPDDASISGAGNQLFSASVVGDGGVSWRLKALKRAKEQAAREGRKLDDVVEERWGSLGQLAASVATRRAAPAHAHLHAIKDRKRGQIEKPETVASGEVKGGTEEVNRGNRDYLRDVSSRHPEMKKPKQDYLPWKKNKGQKTSSEQTSLISEAISGLNKFTDDGSFMDNISRLQGMDAGASNSYHANIEANKHMGKDLDSSKIRKSSELCTGSKQVLSANQLSAKILQLRMKGKHEEAEKLSKEMEAIVESQEIEAPNIRRLTEESTSRYVGKQMSNKWKKKEEDADLHLAQKIIQNKQYSMSGNADDEYDYDDAPSRKRHRKREGIPEEKRSIPMRILTQQERCWFCFENPSRPKHLVISIANFTYMMLPHGQPIVQGHCCILPMQHESSTRTVDKNVWEEIRNFKKCLLRMFARQDKDVVFLENVIDLARQRRHCVVECIPIPCELAKEAPMYFRKAIDEAEDEWGQHEMKKVIPTSGNLRNVIPENLSYFHVEFGLDRGFAHVIDDDSNFKSSFGLNVIRGMLRLPEEDLHRHRRNEPVEKQKQAAASFAREWVPFDWTKQLD